jgi:hypothetical protein
LQLAASKQRIEGVGGNYLTRQDKIRAGVGFFDFVAVRFAHGHCAQNDGARLRQKVDVKKSLQLVAAMLLLAPLGMAQQSSISREGDSWAQAINGTLATAKVLQVKIDAGSVRVEGGSQQGINYEIHNRVHGASEETARRQFEEYKISAYVRGDTAWIVGDWQGGHTQRFSGDFVIHVPRDMELVNIQTDGAV